MTTLIIATLTLSTAGPAGQTCTCSYSFIGNGCCDYQFDCRDYGTGPIREESVQITDSEVLICSTTVQNCAPCSGSTEGSCSGSITYTDTGGAGLSAVVGVQEAINRTLVTRLGGSFNVTAQFQAGYSRATSVSISNTYTCGGRPDPCRGITYRQFILVRSMTFPVPVYSQRVFRTRGLASGAPTACFAHPEDCPVENEWRPIGVQEVPCAVRDETVTGRDEISGVCRSEDGPHCGGSCVPCTQGINNNWQFGEPPPPPPPGDPQPEPG